MLFTLLVSTCLSLALEYYSLSGQKLGSEVKQNLLNSKSSVLGFISSYRCCSLNYREVDIQIYNPRNDHNQGYFSIKHKIWARKRNVSEDVAFTQPKHVFIDIYKIVHK